MLPTTPTNDGRGFAMTSLGFVLKKLSGHGPLFSDRGRPLKADELASTYLPLFAWRANEMHRFCTATDLGFTFAEHADHPLGYRVAMDDPTQTRSAQLMYLVEAVLDGMENLPRDTHAPTVAQLDELVDAFRDAMAATYLPLKPNPPMSLPAAAPAP